MATPSLQQHLPDLPPALLRQLSPGAQQQLLDIVLAAQKAQESACRAAIEEAFAHVPALLRSSVRKILAD